MRYLFCASLLLAVRFLPAQDLALAPPGGSILSPVSGCSLTSGENVTVRIFNFGNSLPSGTSFNVSYSINGAPAVSETVTLFSSLLSNSSFTYTFVSQANLSAPGTYNFDAAVSLPGDVNPQNNTYTSYQVTSSALSSAGSVSSDQSVCSGSNSGSLALSGNTGSILRWETTEDAGSTWRYVSQTTSQQNFLNLGTTTSYRAVVQNGSCPAATSSAATITVSCALPLTWLQFSAKKENGNILLHWQTANEVNTEEFIIQRQATGNPYQTIGIVPAAQTAGGNYSFTDNGRATGTVFYRIKEVDRDGRTSYSPVVKLQSLPQKDMCSIINNPVRNGTLLLNLESPLEQRVQVAVFSSAGQRLLTRSQAVVKGVNSIAIPLHAAPGVYWMVVQQGSVYYRQSFVVAE